MGLEGIMVRGGRLVKYFIYIPVVLCWPDIYLGLESGFLRFIIATAFILKIKAHG